MPWRPDERAGRSHEQRGRQPSRSEETIIDRGEAPVVCTGIERSFGGLKALRGVDLRVEQGEIFGLVGPNGSGKTTMVNVITGFYPPQAGRVRLFGEDTTRLAPHRVAERGGARTFQNLALFRGKIGRAHV